MAFEIGALVVISVASNEVLFELSLQPDKEACCPLTCLALSYDCSKMTVGCAHNSLHVIKVVQNEQTNGIQLNVDKAVGLTNPGISCVEFRPRDSRIVVSAGWDTRLRYFSAKSMKPLAVLTFHASTIVAMKFYRSLLFSADKDGKVACWNLYSEDVF